MSFKGMDVTRVDQEFRALLRMAQVIHPDQFTALVTAVRAYKNLTGINVMKLLGIQKINREKDGKVHFQLKPAN